MLGAASRARWPGFCVAAKYLSGVYLCPKISNWKCFKAVLAFQTSSALLGSLRPSWGLSDDSFAWSDSNGIPL